jgi:predicted DNA-binding protein (UPF0251 family)
MSGVHTQVLSLQARISDEECEGSKSSDLWLYRDLTIALLRRFLHLAFATGKIPSLLGREFFRAKVSSYRMVTFEDAVIFVHDVEKCLDFLDEFSRQLIARVTLQEYSQEEAADLLRCSRKTVQRNYPEALDHLSEIFLSVGLLRPLVSAEKRVSSPSRTGKAH